MGYLGIYHNISYPTTKAIGPPKLLMEHVYTCMSIAQNSSFSGSLIVVILVSFKIQGCRILTGTCMVNSLDTAREEWTPGYLMLLGSWFHGSCVVTLLPTDSMYDDPHWRAHLYGLKPPNRRVGWFSNRMNGPGNHCPCFFFGRYRLNIKTCFFLFGPRQINQGLLVQGCGCCPPCNIR